jgi:hypothetical protein
LRCDLWFTYFKAKENLGALCLWSRWMMSGGSPEVMEALN